MAFVGMLLAASAIAEEVNYQYDEQGRLIAAYYENGRTIVYSYDAAGNRTETEILINGEYTEDTADNEPYDIVVLPIIGGYVMPYNIGSGEYGGPELAETTGFQAELTYSSSSPLNLRTLANSNGYTGGHATIEYTITNDITGAPGGGNAIETGDWPDGAAIRLTLIINSGVEIYGGGGNGGSANNNGGKGGAAISLGEGLTINNEGTLKGGSGGGYGGTTYSAQCNGGEDHFAGGGGGGGGWPNGLGGAGGDSSDGADGQDGQSAAAGGDGGNGGTASCSLTGAHGSDGGAMSGGNDGLDGSSGGGQNGGAGGLSVATNNHNLVCTGGGSGCP